MFYFTCDRPFIAHRLKRYAWNFMAAPPARYGGVRKHRDIFENIKISKISKIS